MNHVYNEVSAVDSRGETIGYEQVCARNSDGACASKAIDLFAPIGHSAAAIDALPDPSGSLNGYYPVLSGLVGLAEGTYPQSNATPAASFYNATGLLHVNLPGVSEARRSQPPAVWDPSALTFVITTRYHDPKTAAAEYEAVVAWEKA